MGSRQGKHAGNKDLQQDGDIIARSGSKRGSSGRKKKKDTDRVGDSSSSPGNDAVDGKRTSLPRVESNPSAPAAVVMRTRDDGDVDRRPKMGRLSGSFNVPETRGSSYARKTNNNATDFEEVAAARQGASGLPPKTAELKVYRSYSSLAEEMKKVQMFDGQPSLANVKVYRKTPDSHPLSAGQRAMSLPRGFDRSRNFPSLTMDSRGNGRAWGGGGGGGGTGTGTGNGTSGGRNDVIEKRMSAPAMRSTTLPRLYGNAVTSSTAGYRVSKDDLPATLDIQRRLKQFETHLVRNLVTKISRLDPESQLAIVPVAIRLGRPNQLITLRDYVEDPRGIPDDLAARGEFILCVAPAMFTGMAHFRRERSAARSDWPTLARDVVTCVAAEAAAEISRMYEYQIALLAGESSVALLADHAAERILAFVLSDLQVPRLDRNTVVQGVVRGKRPYSAQNPLNPVYVSVIVGLKELKWNLYDVFDKPGLRKDVMLVHEWVPGPGDDDRCPWKFHTSHSADPMLYGYRGQLIEWDFVQNHFRINGFDEAAYGEEMSWRFDDFHRLYPPFRRLFGARAMKRYYTEQARTIGRGRPLPIDRYLMQAVQGAAYTRDAIQPVYRPLEPFTLAEVDGVDWTGVDVPRILLPKKSGGSQTPLSPSGEFPVFTPYSQGGATVSLALPQQYYSPENKWATTGYSPGGAIQRQSYTPQFGSTDERVFPRASPYFGESANAPQRYTPVQDRPYSAAPQSYSPAGSVVRNYSPDGRKPPVSQYYSPGGTLRKIYSSPPEAEVKTEFLEVRASLPPYYSPGGTLRRGLPANGKPSGDTTPRSHSPGGVVVPVVQNHSAEVATIDNSVDPRFANYTLVEEVTTVHSIKASNV